MQNIKIAFIGLGVMGQSMAGHLISKGYKVYAYNRTKAKAQALAKLGAIACDSIKEAVVDADIVISIVGYPQDVQEVYLGENGAFANMKENAIAIDMTTSTPSLAKQLSKKALELNLHMCDAPVTGGDIGAKNGTLTVLFGGEEEIFAKVKDILSAFSKKIVYFGAAGNGQLAKACNQIAVGGTMFSVCECLAFAKKTGLDEQVILDTLSQGAASSFSLTSYGPRILSDNFNPGFFLKHFVKDLKIALDVAAECDLHLDATKLCLKLYSYLEQEGLSELGTQALYKYYMNYQELV